MGEPVKATDWPPRHEDREEEEITMPIETIPVQGGARNPRAHSVTKKGESAHLIPDWKEIGEPD
jgi:hypothetical protein